MSFFLLFLIVEICTLIFICVIFKALHSDILADVYGKDVKII
jgi:hypothetical protein